MRNLRLFTMLLIISVLVFSCKSKAKLISAKNAEMLEIYNKIENNYLNYSTLLIKSSVKFDNGKKKFNLKASTKIKKDSLIIISLSPGLGIELARLKFTNDSIFILDRLSSQLTKADYTFISNNYKIDITFKDIQSILTNELFIYPMHYTTVKEEFIKTFNVKKLDNELNIYRKTEHSIHNLVLLNNAFNSVKKYVINDINNNRNLNITFTGNYSKEYGGIPKTLNVVSNVDSKYVKIKLNYSKVNINKNLNFSFKIPSKYRIIDIKR